MACPPNSDNVFGPRVNPECRPFDFTLLFEDGFFGLLPAALFLVLTPQRLYILRSSPVKLDSFRLTLVKLTLLAVLCILHILYTALRVEDPELHTSVGLASGIVNIIATGGAIMLSYLEDQRSVKPSDLLVIYYSVEILLVLPQLRSLWQISTASEPCRALWTTIFVFNIAVLIAESMHKNRFLRPLYQKTKGEGILGFWAQSFFIWVLPVLQTGYSKVLGTDDLPEMDVDQQTKLTREKLEKAWKISSGKHRLLRSTFSAYRNTFLSAIVPRLCLSAFNFCQPFLITTTIAYIQNDGSDPDRKRRGQAIVGAYVLVYLGWAISTAVYWRQTNRFNTKVRSGLISMVYTQTTRLKASDIKDSAAITLMGTDVERIVQSQKTIHETWASVLEVGIAIWLLERQLLVACVVPAIIAIGSVLAIGPISTRSGQAQKEWIERVQVRVTAMSSMLRDIQSVKILGLSRVLLNTISELRKIELKISERFRKLLIWEIVISNMPTEFAPFATFAVYTIIAVVKHDKTLLSSQAFTSLSLISLVTSPLITFVQAVPSVHQAMSCYLRIEEYCEKEPAGLITHTASSPVLSLADDDQDVELRSFQPKSEYSATPVSFERANVGWAKAGDNKLHDITLRVGSGVTMLIGPVGSGKSTLLCSLLGETEIKSGDVQVTDHQMAYCSQVPFIINDTVRQNITFGSPFDLKWYEFAIWACGLKEDLSDMPGGDLYRAGTDGLSLSGGQKQRVALCRAIYSRRRLVVLDDVFSGLDSNNIRTISTRLFGPNGYFRRPGMTVLLATHTEHLFQYADEIVVLEEGRIVQTGSFDNVMQLSKPASTESPVSTVGAADHTASATQEGDELRNTAAKPSAPGSLSPLRREGTWSVYKYYFRSAGFIPFATCLAFIVVEAVSGDFTTLWIQWWVEANEKSPNKDAGMYLGVYAVLFVIQLVGNVGGLWLLIINIINNTALNLHTDLLTATLSAPLRFFQDTEIGALTNRFSQDMELIDMMLPLIASMYLTGFASCVVKLVILCIVSKYLAVAVPALLVSLVILQRYYLRTSRQVRLLDLEAKAPLYTHFTEAVHGVTTLRAFGMNPWFQEKLHMLLDKSQRPFYMLYCIQQWLTLVMGLIVAALAVIIVAMTTSLADQYNGAAVGVALSFILTFNSTISSTLRSWTSLETTIGAVSRVQRFVQDTPREANHDLMGSVVLGVSGHSQFTIAFENVTAGYSQASPPVLKNLSLTIRHGEKVAICGASGSGKSSIIMSLLRMSEIQSGKISIGGCDISELERQAIHSAINVIPQDPFLLSGTVRFNLDPFGMATDERITSGLQKVDLWRRISTDGGLDMDMSSISSWSVGERQLFALARALVVPRPILILDEATSSVDRETEAFMQEIIEQNFRHQTVIAVIHRFAHIDRFDRVAFLQDGEMLECDSPQALLGRDCKFRQLYRAWERA